MAVSFFNVASALWVALATVGLLSIHNVATNFIENLTLILEERQLRLMLRTEGANAPHT